MRSELKKSPLSLRRKLAFGFRLVGSTDSRAVQGCIDRMRKATTRATSNSGKPYRPPRYICVSCPNGFDMLWHTDKGGDLQALVERCWPYGEAVIIYGAYPLDRHISRMAYAAAWADDRVKVSRHYGSTGRILPAENVRDNAFFSKE